MNECIKAVHYDRAAKTSRCSVEKFGLENARKVRSFHKSFPEYKETPLRSLNALSAHLGVKGIYVKDESYRFGLNAFKVLGGSYSIGNIVAERLGQDISELPYEKLVSDEVRARLDGLAFVTATDGNHGRGVAWTASRLGLKSVVYMPKGSALERLHNIQALGAQAFITEFNYDDAVRLAASEAEKNGWVLVQDTAWDGYEDIPAWIMQGYTTMAYEAVEQLQEVKPTHVFLQAGVGALSGGVTGFISDFYKGDDRPIITIVEPNKADCIFRTAKAADGRIHCVTGSMNTIMAGLACGEPCTIGWEVLRDYADNFVSIPDYVAAKGMRILGNPMEDDPKVISGESGAATLGFVAELMENESLDWLREQLQITADSQILCFSTEGDTDKENYRRIVWDGLHPSF